jgi:ubiquinone/menaquinone biosynthesis C-methylase UbiE
MAAPSSEDVARFHRWSRTYERSLGQVFFFGPVHRVVLARVAESLNGRAPEVVLDVGCGTGRLLRRAGLRWPTARLIGVDPAEGMIDNAKMLTPEAAFHVGRGESIPLPDASVDVAFSTVSFHHWHDQAAGLREIARVLRPNGCFCLADGVLPTFAGSLVAHQRIHTRREISRLFEDAGFRVLTRTRAAYGGVLVTVGRKG